MKNLYLFFGILLFPTFLQAQFALEGKITSKSGVAFNYCKLILAKDSTNLQTVDLDSIGMYRFEKLNKGTYTLHIKIPLKTVDTVLEVTENTNFNLTIDADSYLDDLVITAKQQTIIRKVDRTIFNPANIPVLVGGNASDVIEFAPGVYINGDDIQVAGGSSAQVMLNNKLIPSSGATLISFIQSIPTEDIQFIEIIPIPPVKYAASVRGSLINIQLVLGAKSRQSKGGITAEIGQKFYSQQNISGNYSYRKGKFSLYTNASLDNSKYRPIGTKTINYDTLAWSENNTTISQSKSFGGSLGLNYELGPKTEIGILAVSNLARYSDKLFNAIEKRSYSDSLYGRITNQTLDVSNYQNNAVNFNLAKKIDTLGRRIDFNLDYTHFSNDKNINYTTETSSNQLDSFSKITSDVATTAQFLSGGIDYVHPIKKITLNTGARYSYTNNSNQLLVYNELVDPNVADTSKSNDFNYFEHIQAGYVSVDWKLKKWSFQAGLRGENTIYTGVSPATGFKTTNQYFQLVPKLFAMYETKKGMTWNFNYTRDFNRPGYSELNPFKYFTSNYSYFVGNPFLKPSIRHSIRVSTNIKDFQFNLFADYGLNGSSSVTIYDNATQIQRTSYSNLLTDKGIGFYFNYYKTIKKRLTIDANFFSMYSNTKVTQTISKQNINNFLSSFGLSLGYGLDKKQSLIFKMNCFYNTPSYQQITKNTTLPYLSLSLTKNAFNNRISMKLSASDPFRFFKFKTSTQSNQTLIKEVVYFDTQSIWFSFTYKFGNNQLEVNENRTNKTGEAGRIGK